jgi:hypothetical protein
VLADFFSGGRQAAVTVLQWVGTGGTFPIQTTPLIRLVHLQLLVLIMTDLPLCLLAGILNDKQQDNPSPTTQYSPNEII